MPRISPTGTHVLTVFTAVRPPNRRRYVFQFKNGLSWREHFRYEEVRAPFSLKQLAPETV